MNKNDSNINENDLSIAAQESENSGIREMSRKAKNYENTLNLSVGEPGFVTPKHIIDVGINYLKEGKTHYTPNAGIDDLRKAIAKKVQKENHIEADPMKNVVVTAGATEAIMSALLTFVNPGDEVILPNPTWPNYMSQIQTVDATPVYANVYEESHFKMTADKIEPLITDKTKMLIVNSPANPTGALLTKDELEDIAKLVKKHQLYVISDEPYEKIIYNDYEHTSIGSIKEIENQVITVNSLSKTFAMTGWRIGYAVADEVIISNMIKLNENLISGVNEAFQRAAIEAIENAYEDTKNMVDYYAENRKLIVNGLNQVKGFSCEMPPGAFYVFPNIKEFNMSSEEVSNLILEKTGIITTPGDAFGDNGEGHIRLSFAGDRETIKEAIKRLQNYFGSK